MFKIITIAALLAATTAVPAYAHGWLLKPEPTAAQAQDNASPAPFALSGDGLPLVSARVRTAQQSWWAVRSQRGAERRMAACAAMPDCTGKRIMTASNS